MYNKLTRCASNVLKVEFKYHPNGKTSDYNNIILYTIKRNYQNRKIIILKFKNSFFSTCEL